MSKIRTLEEIRHERGRQDIHGFVLMITGALPANTDDARSICDTLLTLVDGMLNDLEVRTKKDMEVTGLSIRMERWDTYTAEGMPNAR